MQRRRADHGRRLGHADHAESQRRVSEGETFASAAAAVGCSTKAIQRFMARTGGMRPRARARSPLRWSLADREELSRGLIAGDSLRQIAARLGRAVSTISREVAWNGHRDAYRAWRAEKTAARRARRPKREKLATHPRLWREVERRLLERAGRRNRSRRGSAVTILMIGRCACRTRRSIGRCSCRPAGRCAKSWPPGCVPGARNDARTSARSIQVPVGCATWSGSATAPRPLRTAPFPGTGRAI